MPRMALHWPCLTTCIAAGRVLALCVWRAQLQDRRGGGRAKITGVFLGTRV